MRYRTSTLCSLYSCVDSTAQGVPYGAITLSSTSHRLSSQLYYNIHYNFKVSLINVFPHIVPVFEVFRATHRPPPPTSTSSRYKETQSLLFPRRFASPSDLISDLAPSQHQLKAAYCEDQRCEGCTAAHPGREFFKHSVLLASPNEGGGGEVEIFICFVCPLPQAGTRKAANVFRS